MEKIRFDITPDIVRDVLGECVEYYIEEKTDNEKIRYNALRLLEEFINEKYSKDFDNFCEEWDLYINIERRIK